MRTSEGNSRKLVLSFHHVGHLTSPDWWLSKAQEGLTTWPLLLLLLSSCSGNSSSTHLPGVCLLLWASFMAMRDYKQESFCFIIQKFLTFLYCKFCLKVDQIFLLSSLSALVHSGFWGRLLQTEQLTRGFHLYATNILDCPGLVHYFQYLLRFECALTLSNHQTLE